MLRTFTREELAEKLGCNQRELGQLIRLRIAPLPGVPVPELGPVWFEDEVDKARPKIERTLKRWQTKR